MFKCFLCDKEVEAERLPISWEPYFFAKVDGKMTKVDRELCDVCADRDCTFLTFSSAGMLRFELRASDLEEKDEEQGTA